MKKAKTKKGFSLLEAIVAIAIFSIAATMLAKSFSNLLKASIEAKRIQRSTESAQYAVGLMAKVIRNGTLDPGFFNTGSQDTILVFDNSIAACVVFKFQNGVLKMSTVSGPTFTDINKCTSNPGVNTFHDLTRVGDIEQVYFVENAGTLTVQKIGIILVVGGGDAARVQTTVSLRQ